MKIYVLDTNVLLHDAESIFKFDEHLVVIPLVVIEELDRFKKDNSEVGRNARAFSRYIDDLRLKGKLTTGVDVNDVGGRLMVTQYTPEIAAVFFSEDLTIIDNRILATAKYLKLLESIKVDNIADDVILVTKDTNLRIKSDIHGITAEDYKNGKVETDDLYTGIESVIVHQDMIDKVYQLKQLQLADIEVDEPYPNQCFIIHGDCNLKQSALVRYDSVMRVYNLLPQDSKTCDILPRNAEQQFALDMLKDPNISFVSLVGKAGSGKTLMALTAGIHAVLELQRYNKILLLKPIISMDNGHELGFLPGTMEEKLAPWMASYSDNVEVIMSQYIKEDNPPRKMSKRDEEIYKAKQAAKINPMQELINLGLLEAGSLEHMRGRSLPNQYIIVDESQNLTPHALKTLVTRVGEGTKIVLLGDISQIDCPYLDSRSNGLTIAVEAFKEQECAGHLTLRKSERSKLAEIASDIL